MGIKSTRSDRSDRIYDRLVPMFKIISLIGDFLCLVKPKILGKIAVNLILNIISPDFFDRKFTKKDRILD